VVGGGVNNTRTVADLLAENDRLTELVASLARERDAALAEAEIFEMYAKAHQRERMRENARANEAEARVEELEAANEDAYQEGRFNDLDD
jgi:hypothetical protein